MKNTLLIAPSGFKNNKEKLTTLNELRNSLEGENELFWQDDNNALELKKLLIEQSFDTIIICFFDLLESDIPEFQLIKSLALNSKIILFSPELKLISRQAPGTQLIESEITIWKASGRNALLNILVNADLVVVADEADARRLSEAGKEIRVLNMLEYLKQQHELVAKHRPKISIVMLTFNQLEDTKSCLESLFKQTPPGYEVIIVDNGSIDDTKKYLEESRTKNGDIKLIFNETNLGFAKANNQGIRIAKGDYVLLLNNDVILTEGWIQRLVACAESDPAIGVVGPCTNKAVGQQVADIKVENNGRDIARAASLHLMKNAGCWSQAHRIIGFCMLIKKEVIENIGMLDERFGPGGFEDYDYCLRVNQAGFKIMIANDVFVYHIGGRGYTGNNLDYNKLREQNVRIFIEKWSRKALEVLETL